MTDYKPGTVAVATVRGVPNVRVMRTDENGLPFTWAAATPCDGAVFATPSEVTDVRPLVVLNAAAAEVAAELVEELREGARKSDRDWPLLADLADDIEAQTRPPKPAEPTGPAVLVRDRNGDTWASTAWGLWVDLTSEARTRKWCDIDAVEVVRP